jgi:O-antigen/teichoic acid export membrane protein
LISISQTLNNQGFVLLLATFLGGPAVVLYSTHKTATGIIGYSASLFQPAVWSELSFLAARQERARTARVTLLAVRATVLFAGALSVALWFGAPAIYSMWTRHAFHVQPLLLALLMCQGLLAAGWSTASWPLLAANQHHELARWSLANSALTLLGAAVALKLNFGIEGAVIASIAADLICGLWAYPLIAARYLDLAQPKFYVAMLRSLIAMVPAVLLAQLSLQFATTNWSRLVCFGLAGVLSAVPALWVSLGRRDLISISSFWRANEESSR